MMHTTFVVFVSFAVLGGEALRMIQKKVDVHMDIQCSKHLMMTLTTCVERLADGTTYVKTGDIDAMWIRDSAAQLHGYIQFAPSSPEFQTLLEGALRRQAKYISIYPYANAYNKNFVSSPSPRDKRLLAGGFVAEAKYEMDSGAYFLRFLKEYMDAVPTSTLLKEAEVHDTVTTLTKLYRHEQNHTNSKYAYLDEMPNAPRGTPVSWTGMVWNAFRPSDDAHKFGYHIPGNLFLATYLPFVVKTAKEVWKDSDLAEKAEKLQKDILDGVEQYGIKEVDGKKVYCYETDGLGNCNLMDDANVPSLLSIPYLDPSGKHYDHEVYRNTRSFILSSKNPWFFSGTEAAGIGSPHTGPAKIWPMALIMEAFTTDSQARKQELIQILIKTAKDGVLHESFHKDDHNRITRNFFAWPNGLYAELLQSTGVSCGTLENALNIPQLKPFKAVQIPGTKGFYKEDVKFLRYRLTPEVDIMEN